MFRRLGKFLSEGVWELRVDELSGLKAFGVRTLRLLLITYEGFTKRHIQIGASALSFFSLLAVVPIVAMLLALMRRFFLEADFRTLLLRRFADQKVIVDKLLDFAEASLEHAGHGIVTGLGFLVLLWAAVKILLYVEVVFNQIWEVTKGRSWGRTLIDYLVLIVVCPVIIVVATALNVALSTLTEDTMEGSFLLEQLGHALVWLIKLMPLVLTWILFTFLYIMIPNTRVRFTSAFYAALLMGTVFQVFQWLYIKFQVGISGYNAIYGTFAALPLFLIWMRLGWEIVLIGGKFSYAFQHVDVHRQEKG